jgi:DNA-binding transcriptional regulator LsrR (DeoR family)
MDNNQHYLLAQIASMYYEQELTQNEIGKQLGLSRVKVYRLLKQAKENRVVQIKVTWPVERNAALEQAFKERFGLKEALILKSAGSTGAPLLSQIGQLGAQYLERILDDGMTLALCLGSSTFEVVNAISADYQAHVRVAQATGSLPFAVRELDSAAMARQLAEKLGGEVLYLSSPLLADSVEDAAVLRNQREIRRTLDAAGQADVALLGIGNLDPQKSGFVKAGFITPEIIADLITDGAVGDMAGQIFTLPGELHPCRYNQRVIGITFDDLCRVPTVIAVAVGREKAAAILGALRTCVIKVFCTDEVTARDVLNLNGAN